jgi:hypothetical protein
MFADLPWESWCDPDGATGESRSQFREAWAAIRSHEPDRARRLLLEIADHPGAASRAYAQAWHFLRGLGVSPPSEHANHVFGAIVEITLPRGFDLIGAYEDHTARYWNFGDSGVAWERPDDSLDPEIDAILEASRKVVETIGPHASAPPEPPERGRIQISLITPSGPHVRTGSADGYARDPLAGPLIACATQLLGKLVTFHGVHPDR